MKKFLIFMQQNPYANSLALESLEFALALLSFNQPVTMVFKADGLLQLLQNQTPEKLVGKDFTKIYSDLALFGIDKVYVEQNSMSQYSGQNFLCAPTVVDEQEIARLIKEHDVVLRL